MPAILLHRIDPERNEKRFYWIQIGPSLLEPYVVLRIWGRIGGQQRGRVTPCASAAEAGRVAARLVRHRLRRGYRPVTAEGGLIDAG